jgi:hypothetical protein
MKTKKNLLIVCGKCGVVHNLEQIGFEGNQPLERDWMQCVPYIGSERRSIPLGHISGKGDDKELWIDSDGRAITALEFIKKNRRDPKIWWANYRMK